MVTPSHVYAPRAAGTTDQGHLPEAVVIILEGFALVLQNPQE